MNGVRYLDGYKIRAVDAAEYGDEIAALLAQFTDYWYPTKAEDFREWWLAFADESPVGFAALSPSSRWPLTGYLARAGVLKAHRRQGLHRRLIRARETAARKYGWQWMISDTFRNAESGNSLAASGYVMYEPAKPWAAVNAIYWRKQIAATVKSEMPH